MSVAPDTAGVVQRHLSSLPLAGVAGWRVPYGRAGRVMEEDELPAVAGVRWRRKPLRFLRRWRGCRRGLAGGVNLRGNKGRWPVHP